MVGRAHQILDVRAEVGVAKSPPEAPSPVKSKRSTAIPKSVSAREIRAAARVSLLQVKQCANTA
jgi:hypothetical protein